MVILILKILIQTINPKILKILIQTKKAPWRIYALGLFLCDKMRNIN